MLGQSGNFWALGVGGGKVDAMSGGSWGTAPALAEHGDLTLGSWSV